MVSGAVAAAGWAWSVSVSEVASEAVEEASLFAKVAFEPVNVASLFVKVVSEPVNDSHSALSKRSLWR